MNYLVDGKSIPERKNVLNIKLKELEEKKKGNTIIYDYIIWKHKFYGNVLSGKINYYSNLILSKNDEN